MSPVGFEPTISAGERPQAAHLLRSWVRIPPETWIFVCCECPVLSGRSLCDELITRPVESYRLWCVVVCDLETSRIGALSLSLSLSLSLYIYIYIYIYIYDISSLSVKRSTSHPHWLLYLLVCVIYICGISAKHGVGTARSAMIQKQPLYKARILPHII